MRRSSVPNLLTFARIALSPLFILFFTLEGDWFIGAFIVGLLFEITDFLDGAIARYHNAVTGFGKLLDPLADKISRFTVFLCLLASGYAGVLPVALIFYRDMIVSGIRTVAAYQNEILAARTSGKLKAISQSIGITAVLILILMHRHDAQPPAQDKQIAKAIVWVVALVTTASGVDYLRANWRHLRAFASR